MSVRRRVEVALFSVVALFSAAVAAPSRAAAQEPASARRGAALTVAAYNAEWMLDAFDDPYTRDEEFEPKSKEALAALARVIRSLDADVLAIEELESEGHLRAFVAEHLADMRYEFVFVAATNSDRGQNVGLLSRVPIVSATSHRFRAFPAADGGATGRSYRFARDLVRVTLQATPERTLDVFIAHLKSRRSDGDDANSNRWRLAEASEAARVIESVLAADPRAWLLLVGDLNDRPGSPPVERLLAAGLTDVHASLSPEKRVTYLNEPYRGTIDYVLASRALAARVVPESARVLEGDGLARASDHAPVVARFALD